MDETRHCNVTTTLEKRIRPLVLYLCQKVLYETGGDHRQTVWHHPMSLDYCCVLLRWTCSILRSFSWASVTSPAMSVRYIINAFRDEDAENATTATINTHTTPKLVGCPLCIMAYYKFLFVYLYCGQPSTRDHHCYTDIIQRSLSAIGCDIFCQEYTSQHRHSFCFALFVGRWYPFHHAVCVPLQQALLKTIFWGDVVRQKH